MIWGEKAETFFISAGYSNTRHSHSRQLQTQPHGVLLEPASAEIQKEKKSALQHLIKVRPPPPPPTDDGVTCVLGSTQAKYRTELTTLMRWYRSLQLEGNCPFFWPENYLPFSMMFEDSPGRVGMNAFMGRYHGLKNYLRDKIINFQWTKINFRFQLCHFLYRNWKLHVFCWLRLWESCHLQTGQTSQGRFEGTW